MKKKQVSDDDSIANSLLKLMASYNIQESNMFIKMESKRAELLNKQKKLLIESEPIKFFKKTHDSWEKEINNIDDELMKIYESIGMELNDINDLEKAFFNSQPTKKED